MGIDIAQKEIRTLDLDGHQRLVYDSGMSKVIAYYRVSTKQQGASGLGLEAQRVAVQAYAQSTGATIDAEYTEVESGKRADRPKLAAALAHARRNRAKLCIAKLDRLSRNVAFLSALMEAGVEFVACDNPAANRLTIHILAAVAEDEARRISDRTKAALAAAKARGQLLGSARPDHWQGREAARLSGAKRAAQVSRVARRQRAIEAVADLLPMMQERRAAGASLAIIAGELNGGGHRTQRGNDWTAQGVKLVLDRVAIN
jgi:DNA invertase Pin-like site-specific DNA recombinase